MARVPTIAEEDAKRPNRERECLVGERTRIVNRIKATLARGFEKGGLRLLFDGEGAAAGVARQAADIELTHRRSE